MKPATIKEQLMLFIRCDIENPAFDSQSKDILTIKFMVKHFARAVKKSNPRVKAMANDFEITFSST